MTRDRWAALHKRAQYIMCVVLKFDEFMWAWCSLVLPTDKKRRSVAEASVVEQNIITTRDFSVTWPVRHKITGSGDAALQRSGSGKTNKSW